MKFIITIDENKKFKEENPKAYEKSLKKWSSEAGSKKFKKVMAKAFGDSKIDLDSVMTGSVLTVTTRNFEAARAMFIFYKQIPSLVTSVRMESDIVKEEKED